jgi:hypothetical protein
MRIFSGCVLGRTHNQLVREREWSPFGQPQQQVDRLRRSSVPHETMRPSAAVRCC